MNAKKIYHITLIYLIVPFIFTAFISGCGDKGTAVNVEPGTVEFQRTVNINDYINLRGEDC
ncbi:MAG TPA: hypothetical protein PKL57_15280, partial [Candidatus Wallbacteria bacterium]|nr:hypothetical protein [Candidatus Wallbacteria bacterium]